MTTVALIPARGGSKGVPRKNLRPLGGRPLIVWTIDTALAAPSVDRVVVSTDDAEIAATATAAGAEVVERPAELADDDTPDLPVFTHALGALGDSPSAVVWLRPTAPLRIVEDVERVVALLARGDTVRSVTLAEHHPYWMKRLDGDTLQPFAADGDEWRYPLRQTLPPAYRLNGAVDAVRPASVADGGPLFGKDALGYVMPPERSIDIDTELDFAIAEALIARG